jgi:hypothetical protein
VKLRGGKAKAVLGVVALAAAGLAVRSYAAGRAGRAGLPGQREPALLVDEPETLMALEGAGFSLGRVLGAPGESGQALMASPRYALLADTTAADIAEFAAGAPTNSPRHPFDARWLSSPRSHFELTGVVNRLDRRRFEPGTCGEARLVYRLVLVPEGRPPTRLPMTVNVRIPQPRPAGAADCAKVAAAWTELARENDDAGPTRGAERVTALLRALPPAAHVETNLQSIHVPSTKRDMDDTGEYTLRTFKIVGDRLEPEPLLDTPRLELGEAEKDALLAWVRENVAAIDQGTAVLPERFLATRAVSTSPRGLARASNRFFSRLLGDPERAFAGLSLEKNAVATSPRLLMRRLDEMTCVGCHQSRAVAGFHLLGEERPGTAPFNALAVGVSAHLALELAWRKADLDAVRRGDAGYPPPFAEHPASGPAGGGIGAPCGVDPAYAAWTCASGLVCKNIHHAEVGECAPAQAAIGPGDVCEGARSIPDARPEGDRVRHDAKTSCGTATPNAPEETFCAPNYLGFTGGMCGERCKNLGEVVGNTICGPLPSAGYEADCFFAREPVEECLKKHLVSARVRSCSRTEICREDYACARIPGAPEGTGACVPPYFVFQVRDDGPILDR